MTVEDAAQALLEALSEVPNLRGTKVEACMRELAAALIYLDEREEYNHMTLELHQDYDKPGAKHDMVIGPCKCGAWHGPDEVDEASDYPPDDTEM